MYANLQSATQAHNAPGKCSQTSIKRNVHERFHFVAFRKLICVTRRKITTNVYESCCLFFDKLSHSISIWRMCWIFLWMNLFFSGVFIEKIITSYIRKNAESLSVGTPYAFYYILGCRFFTLMAPDFYRITYLSSL